MSESSHYPREVADRLAQPMFVLSLLFLLLLAALIVIWVDMPRVAELAALTSMENQGTPGHAVESGESVEAALHHVVTPYDQSGRIVFGLLLVLWVLFWCEYAYNVWVQRHSDDRNMLRGIVYCIAPPLRLAAPSTAWDGRIWLPVLSWQYPSRQLSRRLARFFSKPVLIIALLILPILLIEYGLSSLVDRYGSLRLLLHVSTGLIWFAFAVEFIIMVSATDKKLPYVKKNWIDLAIILLPLISFLRSIRALRLARLAKVQRLAKLGRVYRMRGLVMKVVRALMLFELVNRLLGTTPEKRLNKLKLDQAEKIEELEELSREIVELQQLIDTTAGDQQDSGL